MQLKKYKKEFTHSYALGPFPCFELLKNAPEAAVAIYAAADFHEKAKLQAAAEAAGVPFYQDDKTLARIGDKEKTYAAGVFRKYTRPLLKNAPHVVLYNPGDMGNLGTIMRTLLGFGLGDLAIIEPGADPHHPKAVRASMGALFGLRCEGFPTFAAYMAAHGAGRDLFPFMLDATRTLSLEQCPKSPCYSLIFGNEARGLPPAFADLGAGILIPQSDAVDSLNLAVSVAVGSFVFTTVNGDGKKRSIL